MALMIKPLLSQIVLNNAIWCDAVCKAHGRPGEFSENFWVNRHASPPFYPNAITLTKTQNNKNFLGTLQELNEASIPGEWAVKDSFHVLDLAPFHFKPLFEATWIYRQPSLPLPQANIEGVRWSILHTDEELARWENAWAADLEDWKSRLFLPTLLADEKIAFIAAHKNEQIIAGAIANQSGKVVGVSNVFAPAGQLSKFWAAALTIITKRFPNLILAGYENNKELAIAQKLGFEALEQLRVWLRESKESAS